MCENIDKELGNLKESGNYFPDIRNCLHRNSRSFELATDSLTLP